MAVGPFEPTAFCVTGGTGVANDLVCSALFDDRRLNGELLALAALRESWATVWRVAMLNERVILVSYVCNTVKTGPGQKFQVRVSFFNNRTNR